MYASATDFVNTSEQYRNYTLNQLIEYWPKTWNTTAIIIIKDTGIR